MGALSFSVLTDAHMDEHSVYIHRKTAVDYTNYRHPPLSRGLENYLVIPIKTTAASS